MEASISFSPIFMLLMALSGNFSTDAVLVLPVDDYFEARKIDNSVAKMMELAARDPTDAKAGLQQLLALRVIAEDPARVKKAAGFAANLRILEDIAAGKKAQDRLGFSREYAAWAIASLTDKKLPGPPARKKLVDVLGWFPDVNLAIALEIQSSAKFGASSEMRELIKVVSTQISERERRELYGALEEFGNCRIERIAVGYVVDAANKEERLYYRVTGKADHQRLTDFLTKVAPGASREKQGPQQ